MAGLMQAATKHQIATGAAPLLELMLGRRCSGCDIDAVVLHVSESQEGNNVPVVIETGVRFVEMVVWVLA